jgi:glycosyltransferase involved in cell wall biosynthesis
MDFSTIIPTFRRPEQLREAIGSVLGQTGVALEVFVIDDSPEGSAEAVVREFGDTRLSYRRNPTPSGGRPAIVRNLAWPDARGTFIHFLDDDDLVPDGHYAAVKSVFAVMPEVGVVFGQIAPFGSEGKQLAEERAFFARAARRGARFRGLGSRWLLTACMLFHETLLVCSAGIMRRDCVAAIHGFDTTLPLMEDVDFYARAIRRFGAHFMDRVSLHYRIGPSLMRASRQSAVDESYRRMHARYRLEHGALEINAIRVLARLLRGL